MFIPTPYFDLPRVFHGPDAISKFMRGWLEAWKETTIAAEEFIEADGSVVVTTRTHAVGRSSGVAGDARGLAHVWTFRGRAVIRIEAFATRAEALAAVGLSE